jgi:hypothetical protein
VGYYERASETRRLIGDPFQRIVERSHRRGRYLRVGVATFAIAVAASLVVSALWLFNNVSWQDVFSDGMAHSAD